MDDLGVPPILGNLQLLKLKAFVAKKLKDDHNGPLNQLLKKDVSSCSPRATQPTFHLKPTQRFTPWKCGFIYICNHMQPLQIFTCAHQRFKRCKNMDPNNTLYNRNQWEKMCQPWNSPNEKRQQNLLEKVGKTFNWLVLGPPLWKIWVRQLGWLATQY